MFQLGESRNVVYCSFPVRKGHYLPLVILFILVCSYWNIQKELMQSFLSTKSKHYLLFLFSFSHYYGNLFLHVSVFDMKVIYIGLTRKKKIFGLFTNIQYKTSLFCISSL